MLEELRCICVLHQAKGKQLYLESIRYVNELETLEPQKHRNNHFISLVIHWKAAAWLWCAKATSKHCQGHFPSAAYSAGFLIKGHSLIGVCTS